MAVKTQQDLRSPLFLGVDTQPDGSVIVTCDKSVKEEAEVFISHLAIHLEQIFGVAIWEALPMTTKKACHLLYTATPSNTLSRSLPINQTLRDLL